MAINTGTRMQAVLKLNSGNQRPRRATINKKILL